MVDKAKCPYCKHENDMTETLHNLEQDYRFYWECDNCGDSFSVHAIIDVHFEVGVIDEDHIDGH